MNRTRAALLAATLAGAAGLAGAADPELARNLAATCANCHGTNGRSAGGMESLAGERKEKLLQKLQEFRSGARPASIMQQIAKGYTEAQLERIAAYFAAQRQEGKEP